MLCHICSKEIQPKLLLQSKESGFDVYRCPECEITFVDPQPDVQTLNDFYNGMYSDLAAAYDEQKMQWARDSMQGYLKQIKRLGIGEKNNFIDLGGGLGYYSKAAVENGLNVTLVESDPVSVKFAAEKLGLENIIKQNLYDFLSQDNKLYDFVFLRQVIEHVTDPDKLINGISKLIAPGGILVIETDNNAGVELLISPKSAPFYYRLYKTGFRDVSYFGLLAKRPLAADPPRHLFAFRMSNMALMLENNGLKPLKKIHYRLGDPVYWPNLKTAGIGQVFGYLFSLRIKSLVVSLADYVIFPFRLILRSLGMSSGICIYAVKD